MCPWARLCLLSWLVAGLLDRRDLLEDAVAAEMGGELLSVEAVGEDQYHLAAFVVEPSQVLADRLQVLLVIPRHLDSAADDHLPQVDEMRDGPSLEGDHHSLCAPEGFFDCLRYLLLHHGLPWFIPDVVSWTVTRTD